MIHNFMPTLVHIQTVYMGLFFHVVEACSFFATATWRWQQSFQKSVCSAGKVCRVKWLLWNWISIIWKIHQTLYFDFWHLKVWSELQNTTGQQGRISSNTIFSLGFYLESPNVLSGHTGCYMLCHWKTGSTYLLTYGGERLPSRLDTQEFIFWVCVSE